jgi:hypothetical protein
VAASYGLLLVKGTLEMITPDGQVGPTVPVAPPSLQTCVAGLNAWLEPPVSATADKVFYRDGDTRIRYLTPAGETGDATTVPGGATTVSFFSVSPDDRRIAVMVEDFSPATQINLRLYVEDLHGGGNHIVIYSTRTSKGTGGTTLWPMGWHQGNLVLAQVKPCTGDTTNLTPSEWHLANASTGARMATIIATAQSTGFQNAPITIPCFLGFWPSPAGIACVNTDVGKALVYDWTARLTATVALPSQNATTQSALSGDGQGIFFSTPGICDGSGDYPPLPAGTEAICPIYSTEASTAFRTSGRYGYASAVTGACLWIDRTHLLTPDAVMTLSQAAGNEPTVTRTWLKTIGTCAGHYPGGL